jgi:hypothetical protein
MIKKQVVDHFVEKDEVWVRGYVWWRFRGLVLGVLGAGVSVQVGDETDFRRSDLWIISFDVVILS